MVPRVTYSVSHYSPSTFSSLSFIRASKGKGKRWRRNVVVCKQFRNQFQQSFKELMFRFVFSCRRFYSSTNLESDARRFVMLPFMQVSQQSEELLGLPVEELQAILGSDELNANHEEDVWKCILQWIDHDAENRKGHIADLMKNVRLGLLDARFFHKKCQYSPENVDVYVQGSP
jgi:hypothetical protein